LYRPSLESLGVGNPAPAKCVWGGVWKEEVGMTEGAEAGRAGQPFESIDPKLTVFALANGTELTRTAESRRLEWFRDGQERAILITRVGEAFAVRAQAWAAGTSDALAETLVAEAAPAGEVTTILPAAIEVANSL
jgi:hypothetical protein